MCNNLCDDGGSGSGSKPGTQASNFKDGRFLYRQRISGGKRGGRMVGHIKPAPRDKYGNICGPLNPELHKASNLKLVTRSENAKGSSNRVQRPVKKRKS